MADETYVVPSAPRFLHKAGLESWEALCAQLRLSDAGQLALLAAYCGAVDREAQARRRVRDDGAFLIGKNGRPYAHPALVVESRARAQAATILGQLERARIASDRLELSVQQELRRVRAEVDAEVDREAKLVRHGGRRF